jgi:HTH-type transcriptional regulator / antitoxin HigA
MNAMNIRPIRNDQDYRAALKALSPLFDNEPEPGTPEGDHFDVMVTLVEAYEARQFPVDLPNPVDAIKFRMEQSGLTASDLAPAIGRTNRVYEVLNGTRSLTLPMIWRLHSQFGIPAESLIKPVQSGRVRTAYLRLSTGTDADG